MTTPPSVSPPGPKPIGCRAALVTLVFVAGVVSSAIMFWRTRDPAWLGVSLLWFGFRKWAL